MKKLLYILSSFALLIGLMTPMAKPVSAADLTTIAYGNFIGNANWFSTHFLDFFGSEVSVPVWDLTQGDLVLSYTLDMSYINQPHGLADNLTEWEAYTGPTAKDPANYPDSYTPYIEVGLRGEGAGDFNPGPFGGYQGNCGGWMVSECDDWVGYWDGDTFIGDGTETQDLDDKHGLQASGGRSELDYDVLLSTPDTVDSIPSPYPWYPSPKGAYGSWDNHGLWFDRDGVDEWQATSWGNSGENAGRINTAGIYNIEITYHAIDANGNSDKTDDGLGVMFAKINGVQQGFYTAWVDAPPQNYPVGLSFKGDMEHMQVFAGSWAGDPSGWDYGMVHLTNISVTGYPGISNPLAADFNYTVSSPGTEVQFNDLTSGGMPPYTYLWQFGDGGASTEQNPVHDYGTEGDYTVELMVTPFRCVPKTITKTVHVGETPGDTDNLTVNTEVTVDTGGGELPSVKCKWEQQPVAVEPTMEDGDTSHQVDGFQILPPLVAGAKKMIEYYAVLTDEEDGGNVGQAFADVYHPAGSPEPYGPSVAGGILGKTYFKYEIPFTKLGHSAAEKALVQAAYDAGLITFGAYTFDDVMVELDKGTADLWKGQAEIDYEQPAGNYDVYVFAIDSNNGFSPALYNQFTYVAVCGIEVDFTGINFGSVNLNTEKMIAGDTIWDKTAGINKATVRNIGNTWTSVTVEFDDMGLGKDVNNQWNVGFDARMGSDNLYYIDGILPYVETTLVNALALSHKDELDLSIKVIKGNGTHTGTVTLGCVQRAFSDPVPDWVVGVPIAPGDY